MSDSREAILVHRHKLWKNFQRETGATNAQENQFLFCLDDECMNRTRLGLPSSSQAVTKWMIDAWVSYHPQIYKDSKPSEIVGNTRRARAWCLLAVKEQWEERNK